MNLVKSILTKNPCYTAGRTIAVKGLMLHSVGCSQPNASVFINNWNSASYDRACVHGFIDGNTGTVYQTLPWNHRGWHAGGAANNTHIGVEMCEPACIKYTGGSSFTCSDTTTAKACAKRTYEAAVELFAMLCKEYNLDPMKDGVIISHREGCAKGIASNHGDPEHLWNGLNMGYTMNTFRKAVKDKMSGTTATPANPSTGMQATAFKNLSEAEAAAKIGELCKADMKTSGILASVSAAQFILESGYGKSELAQNANNCFGMKCSLSGNTWSGSTWDGKSKYVKETKEEYTPGTYTTITAEFRKYPSVEKSIADHSAYLAGAMNGSKKRYDGLVGCKDYKKAAQIIKDGGYATSSTYVSSLCSIIERFNLTKYDVADTTATTSWYRVRKTWADSKSQIGAYKILDNAKACVDKNPGYSVFDPDGKKIYPVSAANTSGCPFLVQVSIADLNIRKGPGTNYAKTGMYTGKGVFTIVEVKTGTGSKAGWGRLKSGAGWISLDYGKRV
ncbi:glucosaminidase domain-containing protein [Mogibacterium kristiansenii]|uniref:glucosaminidase domain-containing protein n=1 Tax=Mogibacterium kristiansenii TaxID=2606708 RepID=UPI0024097995|nr:glucosaminidase domain-containing protein [Mogibacterium kristiansenii]MDD6699428.1 glucosaminidase domain-containing protein [Mogibacterium kristiansenii]